MQKKLASENLFYHYYLSTICLLVKSNLSLATWLLSWKVSLEPWTFVVKRKLIQADFDRVLTTSVVLRSSSFQTSEHDKPENMLAVITLNWPSIVWYILKVTIDWEAIYHTFKILYKTQAQAHMFAPLSWFNSVCIWSMVCSAKKYTSNMRKRNLCKTDA